MLIDAPSILRTLAEIAILNIKYAVELRNTQAMSFIRNHTAQLENQSLWFGHLFGDNLLDWTRAELLLNASVDWIMRKIRNAGEGCMFVDADVAHLVEVSIRLAAESAKNGDEARQSPIIEHEEETFVNR